MKFIIKCAALLTPVLALATPAFAYPPNILADTSQPASLVVFPQFVNLPAVMVDGIPTPRTEIEIGAVCPPAFTAAGLFCVEHQSVKVRFHWVCPGIQSATTSNFCAETDFEVVLSVDGKLAFTADGNVINTNSPFVPAAPCPRGYLIGWVINPANDLPIRFDGLVGNAVIRGPEVTVGGVVGSTSVSTYSALGIQADPALALGTPAAPTPIVTGVDPITGGPTLQFGFPGGYTTVPGTLFGDVKYDNTVPHAAPPTPTTAFSKTYLILLTLDVRSNQPNYPTIVPLKFYNESLETVSGTNPNFERLVSTSREFICWDQVSLATDSSDQAGTGPINRNLTQAFMQTRKGIVVTGQAQKTPELGIFDKAGPVTLIGLVLTIEGTAANAFLERRYNFSLSTNGVPVQTTYVPF